jgi:hypothetical protein
MMIPTTRLAAPPARLTRALAPWMAASLLIAASSFAAATPTDAAQACRPVPGTTLEKFYPVMPGWTRGTPQSETDASEAVSRTTVDFDRDTQTISVELMDSCRDADVLHLMRDTLKTLPPGTPGTSQRHTTVNGFPAYEEFTAESGHGEIHVLVADRFMVKITAESSDLGTLQNAARLVPMTGLAALK